MVSEKTTQVDFVSNKKAEPISKEDKLRATLAKLFPHSSIINLHHLKPLYVMAHIKRYPISKVFVDYGATVNIMVVSMMKAL